MQYTSYCQLPHGLEWSLWLLIPMEKQPINFTKIAHNPFKSELSHGMNTENEVLCNETYKLWRLLHYSNYC